MTFDDRRVKEPWGMPLSASPSRLPRRRHGRKGAGAGESSRSGVKLKSELVRLPHGTPFRILNVEWFCMGKRKVWSCGMSIPKKPSGPYNCLLLIGAIVDYGWKVTEIRGNVLCA